VGFAMSILDEKEAQETLKFLRELDGSLEEEMKLLKQSDIN
jgi:hydrogenase maturation factor